MEEILLKLYEMTAIGSIVEQPSFLIMYVLAFVLLYLGIKKEYEPLLLIPIAFGVLIANFPGGDMGVLAAVDKMVDGEMYHNVITLSNGEVWADANGEPYNIYEVGLPPDAGWPRPCGAWRPRPPRPCGWPGRSPPRGSAG